MAVRDSHKVYVALGFHINFYHSWRGDTPDEAGFGTDIRIIREILKTLDRANAAGLKARGYWDTEVYWTFQEILPRHSSDILEGIRRRVAAGLDEVLPGPFNNGANHAATEDEFRASVQWALENEWGSGLRQLFGKVAPFYRPQEMMLTVGQEAILKECGMDGLLLYYAGVPFNSLSTFIPRLDDEKRYNPLWFRSRADQPPLILMPCIAAGDLIEQVSLESLMLDLHKKQLHGEIESDVLININEDADLETWLPSLSWIPNMGGLEEFLRVVNNYDWADFAVPSEYAASHAPLGEIIVRQDLADGGFDGNYSWAEKCGSLRAWSLLEKSRISSYRAQKLADRAGKRLDSALWEGVDSAFFHRLIGLTTTHFGMSTPVINEERQNKAYEILGSSLRIARNAEREVAGSLRQVGAGLYDFELYLTPPAPGISPAAGRVPLRLPVVLPAGLQSLQGLASQGERLPLSLTDVEPLSGGRRSALLRFVADLQAGSSFRLTLSPGKVSLAAPVRRLKNQWLQVDFSEGAGIESFIFQGEVIGRGGFLDPFVTYGNRTFRAKRFELIELKEAWDGLQRVRLKAAIPMETPAGIFENELQYTFTLFDDLPYLLVDVEARYAYTPPRQVIHNMTQKLRRLMDLRWTETAPFQITPALGSSLQRPLRVWKHNYLGITSYYDLDYGRINPKNRELDSFNHQVTAGWVAASDGKHGLLVGEDAALLSSMAFCPMRLRETDGVQRVSLNPFGSYYGRQPDYSHLGGNGNGAVIMQAFSGALASNGPSFNGETLRFTLMLAPYLGDEPPLDLQQAAGAHFYAPGGIVHSAPPEMQAVTIQDIEDYIEAEKRQTELRSDAPVDPPRALLANPAEHGVDLVWDAPRQGAVTGYEVCWRSGRRAEWKHERIGSLRRWHLGGLENGKPIWLKLRALRRDACSDWTPEQRCVPGAVGGSSVLSMLRRVPLWTMLKVIVLGLGSQLRGRFVKWADNRRNNGL
jgi:hypothetical protein